MSKPGKHALSVVSPSFSAILFAGLPKCPACLLFLLAPLGIPFHVAGSILTTAALVLLAVPLVFLSMPACRKCSMRPLYLAMAGAVILLIGRFGTAGPALPAVGAVIIFAAVLWGKHSTPAHC